MPPPAAGALRCHYDSGSFSIKPLASPTMFWQHARWLDVWIWECAIMRVMDIDGPYSSDEHGNIYGDDSCRQMLQENAWYCMMMLQHESSAPISSPWWYPRPVTQSSSRIAPPRLGETGGAEWARGVPSPAAGALRCHSDSGSFNIKPLASPIPCSDSMHKLRN